MKRLTVICRPFVEVCNNKVLIINLPWDGNCLIKSGHVQFRNMNFHKTTTIKGLIYISYLMQDISIFLDSRGLPYQPGKGQICFIEMIKCSAYDQKCMCESKSRTWTQCVSHTKWNAIYNVMTADMVKLSACRIRIHGWRSDTMGLRQWWWVLLVSAQCIWQQGDVTVNGSVMTTGWLSHSWLPDSRYNPWEIYKASCESGPLNAEVSWFVHLNKLCCFSFNQ